MARALVLQNIYSPVRYQLSLVRGGEVQAGESDLRRNRVTLDFADINGTVYDRIPEATFDASMIFFHELAHVYHQEIDIPNKKEYLDPHLIDAKYTGAGAVENLFINPIRAKLGLPPRTQYDADIQEKKAKVYFEGGHALVPDF